MLAKPRKELNKQSPQKNGRLAGANPVTSILVTMPPIQKKHQGEQNEHTN